MPSIPTADWRPRGIPDLEPAAWQALRHVGSIGVVAGPGAGKTEFLAQKAVSLLETGACPRPYRILAISFKTDAASNLADRVRRRCPPELASRFLSLTFDSFTKGLLDRFLKALPTAWRPSNPYEIATFSRYQVRDFLENARLNAPEEWHEEIAGIPEGSFETRYAGTYRLPIAHATPDTPRSYVLDLWWQPQLRDNARSSLSFISINRLAELLVRVNPQIRRALQVTYPFVFVDEFQDTTYAQYDLLLSAFANSHTAITAVGDEKQRIMAWAGARPDAFHRFQADFGATAVTLLYNFRSSPDLVRIQHVVALALDGKAVPTLAQTATQVDGDVAQVWVSSTKTRESSYLAGWIADDMRLRGRSPRDYALLVRQKADTFEADLALRFVEAGLQIRNESHGLGRTTLQDLLADDLCKIALSVLRLGATRRAPEAWRLVSESVQTLRAANPDDEMACRKAELGLTSFLRDIRQEMADSPPDDFEATRLAERVFGFLDLPAVARTYPEYATGETLEIMVEAFRLHLAASVSSTLDWSSCLDAFEGIGRIPLMTVHKSKGLEYDTIVFVGLDDDAWWAHVPGNPEGIATFFVALSRAKQRAIFSFCEERGRRRKVAELYQLLTDAGVPEIANE